MHDKLSQLTERFNALETRMRVLLALVAIALIYMLFDLFWFGSTEAKIKDVQTQIVAAQNQTDELVNMQKTLNNNVVEKRNDPKSQKIVMLEQQIQKIRTALTEKTVNLVPAEQMANVVKDIIDSSDDLKLQSLIKQQSVGLSSSNDKPNEPPQENSLQLYRHSVEIKLQGSYSSTYEFLKKLENMEKKVAFDNFEYKVDKYPNAEIKLFISTLSLNKEWIGG